LGRDPVTGKPKYKAKSFAGTKREAERALARLNADVQKGETSVAVGTVGDFLDRWFDHIEREGRSPTTMRGYRSLRNQLPPAFLRSKLAKVPASRLDELYAHLAAKPGRGPRTIHNLHAMLRAAFKQAIRWELLDRNPCDAASPPRVPSDEIQPPAIRDVLLVLKAADESNNPENGLAFRLLAATGCRRAEICGLRWQSVQFDTNKLVIERSVVQAVSVHEKSTKTNRRRTVTIDERMIGMLQAHRAASEIRGREFGLTLSANGFVFSNSPDGTEPIHPDRLTQAWRRLADAKFVDARLHDLRHLQASMLIDAGEPITTVASRLGHSDTATTLRVYAHLMPGADERAATIVSELLAD